MLFLACTTLVMYQIELTLYLILFSGEAKGVGLANQDGLTDRWFTIRYAKNDMKVTAREEPTLLHISVNKLTNKTFLFTAPNQKELLINTRRGDDDEKIITTVFGDKIECYDAGDGAAEWISNYLNKPCRILLTLRIIPIIYIYIISRLPLSNH